jgi:hypothetical protein
MQTEGELGTSQVQKSDERKAKTKYYELKER